MNAKNIISIVVFILLIGGIVPFMFGGLSGISGDYDGAVYGEDLGTRNEGIKELEHENVDGDTFKLKYIHDGTTYETTITYDEWELYNGLNEGNVLYLDGTYYEEDGKFIDKSGNGNHGTPYNGATTGTGVVGDGMSFDGVDDYIVINDNDTLDLTNNLTINLFININNLPPNIGGATDYAQIFGKSGFNDAYALLLQYTGTTRSYLTPYGNFAFNGLLTDDTSYMLTITYDGTTWTLYKDGVYNNSKLQNGDITVNNSNIIIGKGAGSYYYFDGNLDEIRIYDRALTADEVTELYNFSIMDKFSLIPENAQIYANYKYGGHSDIINNELIVMGVPLIMMVIFVSIIITKMR